MAGATSATGSSAAEKRAARKRPPPILRATRKRNPAEILGRPAGGRQFKLTVDASGRPKGLRAALAATGPYGRCHSFGIYFEDVPLPLPLASMFMKGVTLSTGRPDVRHPSIPDVLALLADGTVDPVPVFSDVVTFDEAPTALARDCASRLSYGANIEAAAKQSRDRRRKTSRRRSFALPR